jgi:membrane associated rhomboid family serine protease
VPLIGASGAIAGVMAAYLLIRPCARVIVAIIEVIIVPLPLPAWLVIGLWALLQFYGTTHGMVRNGEDQVAYAAHLGGLAAGVVLLLLMRPPHVRLLECVWDPEKKTSGPAAIR